VDMCQAEYILCMLSSVLPPSLSDNIVLLGYLKDQEFVDYLYAADIIMVLTDWNHTLLCGAYEGLAVDKPLILSNKKDLISYFSSGVIPTENKAESISESIKTAIDNYNLFKEQIKKLKIELTLDWQIKFSKVCKLINAIEEDKEGGSTDDNMHKMYSA